MGKTMENDYTRVCADIAATMNQASGMAAAVPGVQHAFMMMACNVGVLAQEERKRLFWEMVEGKGPKSQTHRMIFKNPEESYGTPLFKKNDRPDTAMPEVVQLVGWYIYLLINKLYIAGELPDHVRAYQLYSYGAGSTRFYSLVKVSNGSGHALTEFEVLCPDVKIERVYYTNELEQVERTDLNVLLNVNPVAFVDYERFRQEYLSFVKGMKGGAFEAFKDDLPSTPDWAKLTLVGQYLASDELVVSIENFTVHPSSKEPLAFTLAFYRDDEDRLCYTTNDVAYAFLTVKQGYWQNLPFLIRRLIGKLDIKHTGTWSTDYEIRDNDIFPVSGNVTLHHNPLYLSDL